MQAGALEPDCLGLTQLSHFLVVMLGGNLVSIYWCLHLTVSAANTGYLRRVLSEVVHSDAEAPA